MRKSVKLIVVLFGLVFMNGGKVHALDRTQPTMGKVGDIVFSNSPTNLSKFQRSRSRIIYPQSLILRNVSYDLAHEIDLKAAYVRTFDKDHKVVCEEKETSKTLLNLAPGAYAKIKCLVILSSSDDIRLKNEDAMAGLRIPVPDSGEIVIEIRLRVEDFK